MCQALLQVLSVIGLCNFRAAHEGQILLSLPFYGWECRDSERLSKQQSQEKPTLWSLQLKHSHICPVLPEGLQKHLGVLQFLRPPFLCATPSPPASLMNCSKCHLTG